MSMFPSILLPPIRGHDCRIASRLPEASSQNFFMKLLSKIFISQSTDFHFAKYRFHFAKYRFSFRKVQISISQSTDFISFRFVSQSTISQSTISRRHVGAHPDGHQHGVSIQISINLDGTLLRIARELKTAET